MLLVTVFYLVLWQPTATPHENTVYKLGEIETSGQHYWVNVSIDLSSICKRLTIVQTLDDSLQDIQITCFQSKSPSAFLHLLLPHN